MHVGSREDGSCPVKKALAVGRERRYHRTLAEVLTTSPSLRVRPEFSARYRGPVRRPARRTSLGAASAKPRFLHQGRRVHHQPRRRKTVRRINQKPANWHIYSALSKK